MVAVLAHGYGQFTPEYALLMHLAHSFYDSLSLW
jgi:hypothetical protein